jgi:hypothetical protein
LAPKRLIELFFHTAFSRSAERGFVISSFLIFSPSSIAHRLFIPEGELHEIREIITRIKAGKPGLPNLKERNFFIASGL